MKLRLICFVAASLFLGGGGLFRASAQATNGTVSTAPVYVPDYTHAGEPLPEGIFAWDQLLKSGDATNGQDAIRFFFSFTNVSAKAVTILNVHPSCGCTTAEMPPVPWTIPAGSNGVIHLHVNLQGKTSMAGTLIKTITIITEKGMKNLMLRINVLPPPPRPEMTAEQRAVGVSAAKVDRQAVFKGDCASCHLPKTEGKYGQQLYEALCTICHESPHRATMVPDLHNLAVPTNEEFWRTWVTAGKAGTLMPAFSTSQGGPLTDMQITSLAAYLNMINPSRVPQPPN